MPEKRRVHVTPTWRLFARHWLATVVCTLAMTTLVFGFGGFTWQYATSTSIQDESPPHAARPPLDRDWSIPVFKAVQLFLLDSGADDDRSHPSNWLLTVARLSAAMLFLVVSSSVIMRVLDEVGRLPSLLRRHDHVVICGLGQIGLQLLDDLDAQKRARSVVIVESNPANPWLEYARKRGATVVIGDSTKSDTLVEARAAQAAEIFVVNGDDGINLEVVAELGHLLNNSTRRQSQKPLRVYVHIVDTHFATTLRPYCQVLHGSSGGARVLTPGNAPLTALGRVANLLTRKRANFTSSVEPSSGATNSPSMSVQVFNVPRTAAARLVTNQLWPHAPKHESEVGHYVIIGFGAMGQALAVQLAQLGHFPNCKRSRFTIADREIEKSARSFLSRYPRFTSWTEGEAGKLGVDSFGPEADAWNWNEHRLPEALRVEAADAVQYVCNAEFVELSAGRSDAVFAARLGSLLAKEGVKPAIFICGQQDHENFEMAVQLREQLTCQGHAAVPIFVWLPRQPALADTLSRTEDGSFVPFGECRSAASYLEITDPIRERIGQKIHDDYEQQAIDAGYRTNKTPWSTLSDDFRESNRVAGDHLIIKLAALGLKPRRTGQSRVDSVSFDRITKAQAQLLAEMEHYRWVAERLLAGWRYAPKGQTREVDEANKKLRLNYNLIAWHGLGEDRKKDFDQIRAVLRECQKDGLCVERLLGPNTELAPRAEPSS